MFVRNIFHLLNYFTRFYYSKDQFLYYSNKTIINFSYYFYYYYFNNIKHFIQTALFLPDDSNRPFLRRKIIKNMAIPLLTLLNYKKKSYFTKIN